MSSQFSEQMKAEKIQAVREVAKHAQVTIQDRKRLHKYYRHPTALISPHSSALRPPNKSLSPQHLKLHYIGTTTPSTSTVVVPSGVLRFNSTELSHPGRGAQVLRHRLQAHNGLR